MIPMRWKGALPVPDAEEKGLFPAAIYRAQVAAIAPVITNKKATLRWLSHLVEAGGIEPPSASDPR